MLHLSWLFIDRIARESVRWRRIREKGYRDCRVFYGHERIPGRTEKTGGALIKLQDLNDIFPNSVKNANILYLVNSAMPLYAPIMVREAKRKGAVFILNQNGVAYAGWHGPGWERVNKPMRFLLKNADYVFYQSAFCKMSADRFLGRCKVGHRILYNPVDTQIFTPASDRIKGLKILLAGTHEHFYRVRCAIEMMAFLVKQIPEACLTVAGRIAWSEKPEHGLKEAKDLADALKVGKNIVFKGPYTQQEAVMLFQTHHLLLHTKYNDPCPRLVVEAMACGLPVVYSSSGGVPELVGSDAGIGIPAPLDWESDHPPDPGLLAKAVHQVTRDLERHQNAARKRAETEFDLRDWIKEHESVFQQMLEKKRRKTGI